MEKEEFLKECELILNMKQDEGITIGRGRWRRGAGSGRFIGKGLIRYFSKDLVQINLHNPKIDGVFKADNALDLLRCVTQVADGT